MKIWNLREYNLDYAKADHEWVARHLAWTVFTRGMETVGPLYRPVKPITLKFKQTHN